MEVLTLKNELKKDYLFLLSTLKGKRQIKVSAFVLKQKLVGNEVIIARPKDFLKHIQDFKRDYGFMQDRTSEEYKAAQRVKKHVERFIKEQKGKQTNFIYDAIQV